MAHWKIAPYKAQLDAAIKSNNWEDVEKVRYSVKRRCLEMIGSGDFSGVELAHDLSVHGYKNLKLRTGVHVGSGPMASAVRLATDAETWSMTKRIHAPVGGRDVKERLIRLLGRGNQRPWSTTELAGETGHRMETIARALSELRDESRIVSRRVGRNVLHTLSSRKTNNYKLFEDPKHNKLIGKLVRANVVEPFEQETAVSRPTAASNTLEFNESADLDVIVSNDRDLALTENKRIAI